MPPHIQVCVSAQVYDPWNLGNVESSSSASILVDTYSETGNSNSLKETFIDEEFRQTRGAASYTSWNSVDPLGSGGCEVFLFLRERFEKSKSPTTREVVSYSEVISVHLASPCFL